TMTTMTSRPVTDRYMPSRATTALIRVSQPVDGRIASAPACDGSCWCGADIRASMRAPGVPDRGAGRDAVLLLCVLDTLDEALQLFVAGELGIDRLHRVDEFGLVGDLNDLNARRLDRLARGLLPLVPELAHDRHRFLGRLADHRLILLAQGLPDLLGEHQNSGRERMLADVIELGRLELPRRF